MSCVPQASTWHAKSDYQCSNANDCNEDCEDLAERDDGHRLVFRIVDLKPALITPGVHQGMAEAMDGPHVRDHGRLFQCIAAV